MARTRSRAVKLDSGPAIPSRAMVASAVRYTGAKVPKIHRPVEGWQKEAYRHFDICGEAQFAAKFFSNAVGRAYLRIAHDGPEGQKFVYQGRAVDELSRLYTGRHGQAEMLSAIGMHLTIAGECYLVGRSISSEEDDFTGPDDQEVWEVVSVLEMNVAGKQWKIDYGNGSVIPLSEDDYVIRIWLPRPGRRIEAHSPFRSLLPVLQEIEWATRHIFTQLTSRLAGAGLLMLPNGITFPAPPEGVDPQGSEADEFVALLGKSMAESISNPDSPEALVPITVMAPDEAIDKVKHLSFWSELDAEAKNLRDDAIRRFALGMDLPAEQVLGMSGDGGGGNSDRVSHWGAWQIEEATVKMHVEPVLNVVCNALTMMYLRPLLEGDEKDYYVTYDTSALRLRPDRSKEAMELYDRGDLSRARMLEENGFSAEDAPDETEFEQFLLRRVATGSATPEQVGAALKLLGVDLPVSSEDQGETRETPSPPSLMHHPQKPRTPEERQAHALLPASEGLVLRALELAGKRAVNSNLRGKDRPKDVVHHEVHLSMSINGEGPTLLSDAFSHAPLLLEGIAEPSEVVPVLEEYCLHLFKTQEPHSRERLRTWIEEKL